MHTIYQRLVYQLRTIQLRSRTATTRTDVHGQNRKIGFGEFWSKTHESAKSPRTTARAHQTRTTDRSAHSQTHPQRIPPQYVQNLQQLSVLASIWTLTCLTRKTANTAIFQRAISLTGTASIHRLCVYYYVSTTTMSLLLLSRYIYIQCISILTHADVCGCMQEHRSHIDLYT